MSQSEIATLKKYIKFSIAYIVVCTIITLTIPDPVFNYGFIIGFGLAGGTFVLMDGDI